MDNTINETPTLEELVGIFYAHCNEQGCYVCRYAGEGELKCCKLRFIYEVLTGAIGIDDKFTIDKGE